MGRALCLCGPSAKKRPANFDLPVDKCFNCIYNISTDKHYAGGGGGTLNIIISNSSPRPLYEQIEEQIKNEILAGNLGQGDPLPSIRYLARELKVSVITTKRAYEDLERDGFLQTTPGRGTFVSTANTERLRQVAMSQIEGKLSEVVDAAKSIGLGLEELGEIISTLYREDA